MANREVKRRWRDYQTAAGGRPVKKFIMGLAEADRASVLAAMADVRNNGLSAAKHVQDDLYEVKADGDRVTYRVLFAVEGERSQVLLSLEALAKKSQKLPKSAIETAQKRLKDWQRRSREQSGDERQSRRGRPPAREERRRG
jgi:phage-related protein